MWTLKTQFDEITHVPESTVYVNGTVMDSDPVSSPCTGMTNVKRKLSTHPVDVGYTKRRWRDRERLLSSCERSRSREARQPDRWEAVRRREAATEDLRCIL